MGKYMKKSKIRGDITVMEVSPSTIGVGVRTRAKTLALQRLNLMPTEVVVDETSLCYLQLRSRRLEKPLPLFKQQQQQQQQQQRQQPQPHHKAKGENRTSNAKSRVVSANSGSVGSSFCHKKEPENVIEAGLEDSCGENTLDYEPRDRSTRESTPCSLIRGSDTIGTPGSTTRRISSTATYKGVRSDMQRIMPTAREIEEFFAYGEKQQEQLFIEKYNFDIVNDLPLPGRYEWVQVFP